MYTGFWQDYLDGDEFFDCLGKTAYGDIGFFLHGYCGIFASALSEKFGYSVYGAFAWDDEIGDEGLMHAFCMSEDGGDFIDVRGATDDAEAFFSPFEDEFSFLDELDVRPFEPDTRSAAEQVLLARRIVTENVGDYRVR